MAIYDPFKEERSEDWGDVFHYETTLQRAITLEGLLKRWAGKKIAGYTLDMEGICQLVRQTDQLPAYILIRQIEFIGGNRTCRVQQISWPEMKKEIDSVRCFDTVIFDLYDIENFEESNFTDKTYAKKYVTGRELFSRHIISAIELGRLCWESKVTAWYEPEICSYSDRELYDCPHSTSVLDFPFDISRFVEDFAEELEGRIDGPMVASLYKEQLEAMYFELEEVMRFTQLDIIEQADPGLQEKPVDDKRVALTIKTQPWAAMSLEKAFNYLKHEYEPKLCDAVICFCLYHIGDKNRDKARIGRILYKPKRRDKRNRGAIHAIEDSTALRNFNNLYTTATTRYNLIFED